MVSSISNANKLQTDLFDGLVGPYHMLQFWVKVDQGVMVMKGHSTLPRSLKLEPHH